MKNDTGLEPSAQQLLDDLWSDLVDVAFGPEEGYRLQLTRDEVFDLMEILNQCMNANAETVRYADG